MKASDGGICPMTSIRMPFGSTVMKWRCKSSAGASGVAACSIPQTALEEAFAALSHLIDGLRQAR
jgi:hypothetical protein